MLKKRIIPCLDIKEGRTVKGIQFLDLRDAGDSIALAAKYASEGADELVFLDITATVEKRKTLTLLVEKIAGEINIPFTVGGGIDSLEDVAALINAGADKVSLNSSAVKNPELIYSIAKEFGSQALVVAIDTKLSETGWTVFVHGGRTSTNLNAAHWAKECENLGAGEILLTSMNHDGSKNGFAIALCESVCIAVNIPVIASGGAGKKEHFLEIFTQTKVSAALAASIFHFGEIPIPFLKNYLKINHIAVR